MSTICVRAVYKKKSLCNARDGTFNLKKNPFSHSSSSTFQGCTREIEERKLKAVVINHESFFS